MLTTKSYHFPSLIIYVFQESHQRKFFLLIFFLLTSCSNKWYFNHNLSCDFSKSFASSSRRVARHRHGEKIDENHRNLSFHFVVGIRRTSHDYSYRLSLQRVEIEQLLWVSVVKETSKWFFMSHTRWPWTMFLSSSREKLADSWLLLLRSAPVQCHSSDFVFSCTIIIARRLWNFHNVCESKRKNPHLGRFFILLTPL